MFGRKAVLGEQQAAIHFGTVNYGAHALRDTLLARMGKLVKSLPCKCFLFIQFQISARE